jgi:hypothetical protein
MMEEQAQEPRQLDGNLMFMYIYIYIYTLT